MERREYFIPPSNQINFQIDVPFEKLIVRTNDLPSSTTSINDFVTLRIENTLGKDSVRVIADKEKNGEGNSLRLAQRSFNVGNAEIITVEKNSKISIVRSNAGLYNIKSIKIYDEDGVLINESISNTFDFENIDRNYKIVVESYDVIQTTDYPSFVTSINQAYVWNTEYSNEFLLKIGVSNSTQYVRYYFPNQLGVDSLGSKKVYPVNNEVLINLTNPNALGRFELVILAGNEAVGERDEVRTFISLVKEKTYGEPDVTQIIYDRNIIEADLRPLDFNFEFDLQSVNSEGIEVLIGENKITEIYTQNNKGKIYFAARDLYNSFKDYFNETPETYFITFGFRPFFNGIGGKIFGKTEKVSITVKRTKFLIDAGTAVRDISSVFTQLFSGGDTKKDFEDRIIFEDDKHLYYQVRATADQSFVITNTGMDRLTFSVKDGKVVETQFEIDSETGSTRKKKGYLDYGSLVVKLLEPLPGDIDLNTQVWISKQIIPTIVESIVITDEDDDKCLPLRPNFGTDIINETGLQYFDEII